MVFYIEIFPLLLLIRVKKFIWQRNLIDMMINIILTL